MAIGNIFKAMRRIPVPTVAPPPPVAERQQPLETLSIEGNREGLWQWNLLTHRFRVSKGWAETLGWKPDEIGERPKDWFALIHPYYVSGVRMDLAAHIKGRKDLFESEYRIRHRNGSYRWVLCRGQVIRNGEGVPREISGVQTDVTRLIEVENRLVDDALHDRLTGLPNRNFFNARIELAIQEQRQDHRLRFAVLFLDLDRFKEINDTLGHLIGDELLASTAKRIRECVRPDDFVARFGGDEFVILLEEIKGHRDAETMALRINKSLSTPYHLGGHEVVANASIGIVMSDPKVDTADDLLRNADIAMYQAKSDGKTKSRVYAPAMYNKIERSWKLENEFRGAIEPNEPALVYQPQICPQSGKIQGAEALLRWKLTEGESISPVEFIPLAEKSELILAIGEWVLRQACEEALNWRRMKDDSAQATKISVNVSASQLLYPNFPAIVAAILIETGLDPRTLELELTESVLVDSLKKAPAILRELRRQGISLAIDDFGTGYSAMSYLRDLTPDVIKLDRSFVTAVAQERSSGAIAKGMIGMGHDLGLTVIAEGVEKIEQLLFLKRYNCDLVQGYLASRPVSPETFQTLLLEGRSLILGDGADVDLSPVLISG